MIGFRAESSAAAAEMSSASIHPTRPSPAEVRISVGTDARRHGLRAQEVLLEGRRQQHHAAGSFPDPVGQLELQVLQVPGTELRLHAYTAAPDGPSATALDRLTRREAQTASP